MNRPIYVRVKLPGGTQEWRVIYAENMQEALKLAESTGDCTPLEASIVPGGVVT